MYTIQWMAQRKAQFMFSFCGQALVGMVAYCWPGKRDITVYVFDTAQTFLVSE